MKKPPAFQFYARDYLASARVQSMSLEAEGAYIRLLCYQWLDGFIPSSLTLLARLCKVSAKKMTFLWKEVSPCFDIMVGDGKLANARLETVRQEQLKYRLGQSEHGKHGAEIKKGTLKGTHIGSDKGRASSASASASAKEEVILVDYRNTVRSSSLEQAIPNGRTNGTKPDFAKAWAHFEGDLRNSVDPDIFGRYFEGSRIVDMTYRQVVVAVPPALIHREGDTAGAAECLKNKIEASSKGFLRGRALLVVPLPLEDYS